MVRDGQVLADVPGGMRERGLLREEQQNESECRKRTPQETNPNVKTTGWECSPARRPGQPGRARRNAILAA